MTPRLVCMDRDEVPRVPSRETVCALCGAAVWIANDDPQADECEPICGGCFALDLFTSEDGAPEMCVTQKAFESLVEHSGMSEDQARLWLDSMGLKIINP